jgi:hypothetical protein
VRIVVTATAVVALSSAFAGAALAQSADRLDRRSAELALPDPYLDPSWPDDGSEVRIPPEESDNVENVPLDDEQPDQAEKEDMAIYQEEEVAPAPESDREFEQDEFGETPAEQHAGSTDDEARDPAQW